MGSVADYLSFFFMILEVNLARSLSLFFDPVPTRTAVVMFLAIPVLLLGESIVPWRRNQRRLREGVWLDVFYSFAWGYVYSALFGAALFLTTEVVMRHSLNFLLDFHLTQVLRVEGLPIWSRYVLLVLYLDFFSYWGHRLLHRSNILWPIHKVHHSSLQLDALNAVRIHWLEIFFWSVFRYVPASIAGFGLGQTLAISFFIFLFSSFTHANIKLPLGPLKYILNNPQLHIWHHAREIPGQKNVNYGDALCIWDYIFGTAYLPGDGRDLELGFDDIDEFPTTFWGHQTYPLSPLVSRLWSRPKQPKSKEAIGTRRHWRIGATVGAVVVAAIGIATFRNSLNAENLRLFAHYGYRPYVAALLDAGRPEVALHALERASLASVERLDALDRIGLLNRAAHFGSTAIPPIRLEMAADADLRFKIGEALLGQRSQEANVAGEDHRLFEKMMRNAQTLSLLEPGAARSHYLLGMTHLERARQTSSSDDFAKAASSLNRAVFIDRNYPAAKQALFEAKRGATGP